MGKNNFGGGFGGGNMQQLMRQAQQMQQKLAEAQQELADSVVEGSAGGGAVTVEMTGKKEIVSVKISPSVVDPDDIEMLEDLLMAAIGDATKNANELAEELLAPFGGAAGGLF